MHELLRDHLPEPLVKLTTLQELERRCDEIAAEHPRFREEVPLVLRGETQRRVRLRGLQVVNVNRFNVA
jgi:O6-methylguanine-DNA--protein-cysteine methyltransferase